jgi:signal transduction histidine kinase
MIRNHFQREDPETSFWRHVSFPKLGVEEKRLFDAQFAEQTIFSLKVTMPISCLLHILMLVLDAKLFPDQFYILLIHRTFIVLGCFCVFVATFFRPAAEKLPSLVIPVWLLTAISVATTAVTLKDGIFLQMSAIIINLFYVCGFIRTKFLNSVICCVLIYVTINSVLFVWDAGSIQYYYANFKLSYATIIGLSLSYIIELSERKNFILTRQLKREKQRLDEHSAWLRQLATFLRHEVRQPVAQINSSVELSALRRHDEAALEGHLTDAIKATRHVWNLIERASRATDAEAYVREGQRERIDLQQLLSGLVQSFTNTYSGVEFKYHSQDEIYAFADPDLIKEATGNLLSNAASFAEEQTVIDVFLQRRGSMAEIRVCNKGPLIEGDTNTLFQPFATTRSGSSGEHHGLGLYLVRLIAQQYGGVATIANTADSAGVEATIMIPAVD